MPNTEATALPEHASKTGPLIVWVVSDGKPGHVNQSLGLAEALARATPAEIHALPALPRSQAWRAWLSKRVPGAPRPAPDLILGTGHATHLTLLALRRAHGGRAVVLMKPSLPRRCFDLCILPRHDGVPGGARTLITDGAINRVSLASTRDSGQGLILVGGTSPHFEWNSGAVQAQIADILARTPHMQWTLTDSRRTPRDFLAPLTPVPNLEVVPHAETSLDWLPKRLSAAATVWVTPDSASMVYEALTAGADVGVFDLPARAKSRVARAVAGLIEARRITSFAQWHAGGTLSANAQPLAEADRCAAWILEWLKKRN